MTGIFIRRGIETQTQKGRTPCYSGDRDWSYAPLRSTRDHQQLPEAKAKAWKGFSPGDFRDSIALLTLDTRLLATGTIREYIFIVLNHPVRVLHYSSFRKVIQRPSKAVLGQLPFPVRK